MSAGWQPLGDKRHPFGKGATIISEDNIAYAQIRREARRRIERHQGTPADIELIQGSEALIQNVLDKQEEE